MILANPADSLEKLSNSSEEREPFTTDELRSILARANNEWRGRIALGVHAGLRLTDASSLTWDCLNLERCTLTFWPGKTCNTSDKPLVIALHAELVQLLNALPQGIGKAPVFPSLYGKKPGSNGGLSNQFSFLMKMAGIIIAQGRETPGKGRRTKSKGFHALRHTMITRLAEAEVSADVRRTIAGHSSDAVHKKYIHLSLDAQRIALKKISGITVL